MTIGGAPGGRRRNPRGTGGRLRDEIIDAGIALIDETGDPAALTLRGVARAAGIAAPSIYAHFADLPAVTEAVLERSFAQLESEVVAAVGGAADPASALLAGAEAYVRFGWDHRARYRLMFADSGFAPNAINTFKVMEKVLEECVARGLSESTDPHHDTFLLWVALHGMATLQKPSRSDYLGIGYVDRLAAVADMARTLACLLHRPEH